MGATRAQRPQAQRPRRRRDAENWACGFAVSGLRLEPEHWPCVAMRGDTMRSLLFRAWCCIGAQDGGATQPSPAVVRSRSSLRCASAIRSWRKRGSNRSPWLVQRAVKSRPTSCAGCADASSSQPCAICVRASALTAAAPATMTMNAAVTMRSSRSSTADSLCEAHELPQMPQRGHAAMQRHATLQSNFCDNKTRRALIVTQPATRSPPRLTPLRPA